MTKTRILYGGGAVVTALCAGCTRWCHDRHESSRYHLPVHGRRHLHHHARGQSRADLAGDDVAGNRGQIRSRRGCATPGGEYGRQLDTYADNRRVGTARSCTIHTRGWHLAERRKVYARSWVEQYVAGIRSLGRYEWTRPAHGHHQPVLQRLHLVANGLTAGRGWAA